MRRNSSYPLCPDLELFQFATHKNRKRDNNGVFTAPKSSTPDNAKALFNVELPKLSTRLNLRKPQASRISRDYSCFEMFLAIKKTHQKRTSLNKIEMEPKKKLRGLIRGISSVKSSSKKHSGSNNVKPKPSPSEFVLPSPKLMVSSGGDDFADHGGSVKVDETVDVMAASYINYVRERFKLERVNSDRRKHEDMHW